MRETLAGVCFIGMRARIEGECGGKKEEEEEQKERAGGEGGDNIIPRLRVSVKKRITQ